MNNITLGEEQLQAIELVKKFLSSSDLFFSLSGYAGTGKSTIIKYLVEYFEDSKVSCLLCAPTHKAKGVLKYFTEREAVTVHQLLALSPILEIFNLDYSELLFHSNSSKKPNMFPYKGVVVCDEASMINDHLFQLLCEKAELFECKIIFVGDVAQLRPVKSKYNSKVFDTESNFILTKIYRQSDGVAYGEVLEELRTNIISRFFTAEGENGSLYCYNNALQLFKDAVPIFKKAIEEQNIFEAKMLAYTNNRVSALNNKMREILFPGEEQYYKNEILTCYENITYGFGEFWNSMDYVIISEPKKHDLSIPHFAKLPAFKLNLYDYSNDSESEITILDKNIPKTFWDSLANKMEGMRLEALEAKIRRDWNASKMWVKYFEMVNSFASPINLYYDNRIIKKKSFDYGYAMTVHKSQGSSINNVFVDMKDISKCREEEELRQLQYVALSRSRKNIYIYQ